MKNPIHMIEKHSFPVAGDKVSLSQISTTPTQNISLQTSNLSGGTDEQSDFHRVKSQMQIPVSQFDSQRKKS